MKFIFTSLFRYSFDIYAHKSSLAASDQYHDIGRTFDEYPRENNKLMVVLRSLLSVTHDLTTSQNFWGRFWIHIESNIGDVINSASESTVRDSPTEANRDNAQKSCNNNSSFKMSGDLPYENNDENVHANNQPQDPSDNIADDSDEDDDIVLSVAQKYENM